MASNLPLLEASGAVMFDSPEAVEASWATYVSKGALAVKPERELKPLEQLEVYLFGGGIATPVRLRVEVVVLTPERALLRLIDPAPPMPTLPSSAAPPAPEPEAPPADVARTDKLVPVPFSQSDHGLVAVLEQPSPAPTAAPPPLDDSVMPSPSVNADALPRTSTPFLAMPAPVLPPEPKRTPTTSPGPPALELDPPAVRAPIALERVDLPPAARGMPAVTAEREPAPIVLEPVSGAAPAVASPAPAPAPRATQAAAISPAPPAASAIAALPPFFTGDALRFSSSDDFAAGRPHLENVGAILAVADGKLPTTSVEVRLIVGAKETAAKARVTLAAAAPGTAVVQAAERSGFLRLLAELDGTGPQRPAPAPSQTTAIPATFAAPAATGDAAASAAPRAFTLPRQGALQNPTTAQGILALPLVRPPSDAEIATPSVPLLLRWLRTTRGVLRLEVTAPDHPLFTAIIVDGREVRTPAALATLGRSLSQPRMTYIITELGRPPQMTTVGRTLHLIAESVRGLISTVDTDDLARAFPGRTGMCLRARNDIVTSLGLPAQHQRFIKSDLDGDQRLDEVARAAVGSRTVWETLYLLELYGGLSWDEPDPNKAKTAAARTGTFRFTAPEGAPTDDAWAPFEGKDHFTVLGLHWSSSPTEVPTAYQKLRAEYGAGGAKRPANVATAERILKRLEEAYRVLNEKASRQAYRREKYHLVWAHQAQLLVQKAKLALYRKDVADAMNILLAAEDMAPSDEARALLASIKSKLG